MDKKKLYNESGEETVLNFMSSKLFSSLVIIWMFFPALLGLSMLISNNILPVLSYMRENNALFSVFGINIIGIDIALIFLEIFLYFIFFVLKRLSDESYKKNNIKKISNMISLLQYISLISTVLLFISIFISLSMLSNSDVSWNVKVFALIVLCASGMLLCLALTIFLGSVEKTLKTNDINVKGNSFLTFTIIINLISYTFLFYIMFVDRDFIICAFCLVGIIFDVFIEINNVYYLKLSGKALSESFDEYKMELRAYNDTPIEYFDDAYDNFPKMKNKMANETYPAFFAYTPAQTENTEVKTIEDKIIKDSFSYTRSELNKKISTCRRCGASLYEKGSCPVCGFDESNTQNMPADSKIKSNIIVSGTCPSCGEPMGADKQCPKCGYSMHKDYHLPHDKTEIKSEKISHKRITGTCPSCGLPIDNENICPKCGYSLHKKNDEKIKININKRNSKDSNIKHKIVGLCPSCGFPMHDEKKCLKCGYFMDNNVAFVSKPQANANNENISGTCPACGKTLHGENKCKSCGYLIYGKKIDISTAKLDKVNNMSAANFIGLCPACGTEIKKVGKCHLCGYEMAVRGFDDNSKK